MKQEDFDRFKAVCEKEGFDFCDFLEKTIKNAMDNFLQEKLYLIEKKDPFATRVKKRVEVEYGHYSLPFDPKYILALHFAIDDPNRMNDDAGKFLAKQLEEYLNKE